MTANRAINLLCAIWLTMIALSVVHPVLLSAAEPRTDGLDRLVVVAAWQGMAMIPAIIVVILRLAMNDRLTGPARWLAWIPPGYTLTLIVGFSIFGHIVG